MVLLVRGSYPRGLVDLVMGLDRWCYRVLAYVRPLTDAYPPFRLDVGGSDPAHGTGRVTDPEQEMPCRPRSR